MKSSLRAALLVGVLAAVLLALTGAAVFTLLHLGSGVLAITVGIAGAAAVLVVGVAWWLAREAKQQVGELLPPLPPQQDPVEPIVRPAFRVREARPGEVPEAYLAAVKKGARAREAAWKANAREH